MNICKYICVRLSMRKPDLSAPPARALLRAMFLVGLLTEFLAAKRSREYFSFK